MKDPVLLSYSLEELLYEYHSIKEQKLYEQESAEEESDKIDQAKQKEAEDWADQMEREEAEAEATANKDPSKDPENIKWMEEQMKLDREMFGDDFGKDLHLDFGDPSKSR